MPKLNIMKVVQLGIVTAKTYVVEAIVFETW